MWSTHNEPWSHAFQEHSFANHAINIISFASSGGLLKLKSAPFSAPGWGHTEMSWGVNPEGLKAALLDIKENYGNPKMYITENGCALKDQPDGTGFVADWGRINYLRDHLHAVHDAIQASADIQGYYLWSFSR